MVTSVNTNVGAIVALQNLSATGNQLLETQNEISTGLRISSAKDNGAIFAIAQGQRAEVASLSSATDSLNRGTSIIDTALAAGNQISDLLNQAKQKALAATDSSLGASALTSLTNDYNALAHQITKIVNGASFDGNNLLSGGTSVQLVSGAQASTADSFTLSGYNLALGGTVITAVTVNGSWTNGTASASAALISASIINLNNTLASLGTASSSISSQLSFVSALSDSLNTGIGNLVDANLAQESAKLQALQTKQQLGIQALSIANSSSSSLLSLFR